MKVQETFVRAATRLFTRRQTNATLHSLLDTGALGEILNVWGGGKHGLIRLSQTPPWLGTWSELRGILLDWRSLLPGCPCVAHADPFPGQQQAPCSAHRSRRQKAG